MKIRLEVDVKWREGRNYPQEEVAEELRMLVEHERFLYIDDTEYEIESVSVVREGN